MLGAGQSFGQLPDKYARVRIAMPYRSSSARRRSRVNAPVAPINEWQPCRHGPSAQSGKQVLSLDLIAMPLPVSPCAH
jgi:hypothetical protein